VAKTRWLTPLKVVGKEGKVRSGCQGKGEMKAVVWGAPLYRLKILGLAMRQGMGGQYDTGETVVVIV